MSQYSRVHDLGWTQVSFDNSNGFPQITNTTPSHVLNVQEAHAKRQRKTQTGLCKMDYKKPQAPIMSGHVAPIKPKVPYGTHNTQSKQERKYSNNQYDLLSNY